MLILLLKVLEKHLCTMQLEKDDKTGAAVESCWYAVEQKFRARAGRTAWQIYLALGTRGQGLVEIPVHGVWHYVPAGREAASGRRPARQPDMKSRDPTPGGWGMTDLIRRVKLGSEGALMDSQAAKIEPSVQIAKFRPCCEEGVTV